MKSFQPPRRILVPWDFSERSREALRWGHSLASLYSAELIVLHVGPSITPFSSPFPEMAGFQMDAWQEARSQREAQGLEAMQVALGEAELKSGIQLRYAEAAPVAAIAELVEESKIDLVVMGTEARDGVARAVLGSVAEAVNRHVPVPVLLVK